MGKIRFAPIVPSRVSEHIEKKITESILEGKLKTGDRLPSEKEMAQQFGVSLVTLREALRALELFGIIERKKGAAGGVFVSGANTESIKVALGYFISFNYVSPKHLYEVRKIIEPPMARFAAQNITSEEIVPLERNIAYCEEKLRKTRVHFSKQDFFDIDKENINFHRLIAESTHNPILKLTIDYVFHFLTICEKDLLMPDCRLTEDTINDHKRILRYLKKRDGDKCEKEMVSHLKVLDEYLRDIQGKPNNLRRAALSNHVSYGRPV